VRTESRATEGEVYYGSIVASDAGLTGVAARRRQATSDAAVVIETRRRQAGVPKMVDLGGAKVANAVVRPVFWGRAWADTPLRADIMNNIAAVVAGPYFGRLGQYGVRRPMLEGRGPLLVAADPPARFDDDDLVDFIAGLLRRETLRDPDAYYAEVPVLLLPPGATHVSATPANGASGGHGWVARSSARRPPGRDVRLHFAWLASDRIDAMTAALCRILLGLLTDPEGDGWRDLSAPTERNEIGDLCDYATLRVARVNYPYYWSALDGAGIVPVGPPVVSEVTCIRTSDRRRPPTVSAITHFGGHRASGSGMGQPFAYRQTELIALRDQGERFVVRDARGRASELRVHLYFPPGDEVFGTRCLGSAPDGWRDTRVLTLPDCA
jgi:hypothetical protein